MLFKSIANARSVTPETFGGEFGNYVESAVRVLTGSRYIIRQDCLAIRCNIGFCVGMAEFTIVYSWNRAIAMHTAVPNILGIGWDFVATVAIGGSIVLPKGCSTAHTAIVDRDRYYIINAPVIYVVGENTSGYVVACDI